MVGCLPPMTERVRICLAAMFAVLLLAAPASAEIVYLTTGRTLSVKAHRVDGETIVLTLRGGGEVNIDKLMVEKVVADEVPYPEPEAAAAAGGQQLIPQSTPYGELIASMSEAHRVDPNRVLALT